jgi:uncharacterized protein YndB with AHSA1/START domain
VPTVTRARTLRAAPQEVWRVLSDPRRIPDWWPGVQRVEETGTDAFTEVLISPKGSSVRADYTRLDAQAMRRVVWRQELHGSPFERLLSQSQIELELQPGEAGSTRVALTARQRARGFARLGFVQMRLAAGRRLERALDGLASLIDGPGG